jgi:hypothetical protein
MTYDLLSSDPEINRLLSSTSVISMKPMAGIAPLVQQNTATANTRVMNLCFI